MFHRQIGELRRYLRADYAREITARNRDKSVQERWQLIRSAEEHQRRQLFANARAQSIALFSLGPFAVGAIGLISTHRLNEEIDLGVPQAIIYLAIALYVVVASIVGWHVGSGRARRQLEKRAAASASTDR